MTDALPGALAAARAVLDAADPFDTETGKPARATALGAAWRAGALSLERRGGGPTAPDRPARPDAPPLVAPGRTARRRLSTDAGRAALLHAVAHIEFNAIDLACDMAVRFADDGALDDHARTAFVGDWIGVAADEARHFGWLQTRLSALSARYGDLPAHDGLWGAAQATAGDVAARLAVAPLVLEARGLDVTPGMIARLERAGDGDSASVLRRIYDEEHGHVAIGVRWFRHVARVRGVEAAETFHALVRRHFPAGVKPPFNDAARDRSGLPQEFYQPLADGAC